VAGNWNALLGKAIKRDDPFELVAIVYSQDELALLISRLRWEDIRVVGHSGAHVAADVGLTVALGGVRLLVHQEDADDARRVLAATPAWERQGGVYADSRLMDLLLALLLVLMAGVPPPARLQSVLIAERPERQLN